MLETRFIASVAERDVDLVVLEELSVSDEFREWVSARTHGMPVYASTVGVWHSVSDGNLGESDLVFEFTSQAGERIALLIENKIDAPPQPTQGARYRLRGENGIKAGYWDKFRTCVIAPQRYLDSSTHTEAYDVEVPYEEVMSFFSSRRFRDERFKYKARVVQEAIEQNRRGYQPEYSEPMTTFVTDYYSVASGTFPQLAMQAAKPRPAGSTWIMFNSPLLPKGVQLWHQMTAGFVKLLFGFPSTLESVLAQYGKRLDSDMTIEPAGKSVAIAIAVPKLSPLSLPFEQEREKVLAALSAVSRLLDVVVGTKRSG